jgi:hypothetical protein
MHVWEEQEVDSGHVAVIGVHGSLGSKWTLLIFLFPLPRS